MKNLLAKLGRTPASRSPTPAVQRQLRDQAKQIVWLERLVTELLVEQRGFCLMPPPELRLHVGAHESAGNFWNQGRGSSARVIEVFGEVPPGQVLDWGCGSGRTLYWLYARQPWRANSACSAGVKAWGSAVRDSPFSVR